MDQTLSQSENELYRLLSAQILQELRKREKKATVPKGARLVTQGIHPGHLIIVDQGSVEISMPAGERTTVLAVAGQGRVLGLRSVVGGEPPEADVTALEECAITLIPAGAFAGVVERHAEMYFAIATVLSGDLKTAQIILRELPSHRPRRISRAREYAIH